MAELKRDSFTEGVKADMYAYMPDAYPSVPPVYSQIFEVASSDSAYELSTTWIGPDDLVETRENEPFPTTTAGEGFTVSAKMRTYKRRIEFGLEQVQDMNPKKLANMVVTMAGKWTQSYIRNIEELTSSAFLYGGYTAGHDVFNATVAGYTDPTGNLCYDGKPFFNLSNNTRPLTPGGTASKYNGLAVAISESNLQTAYDLLTVTNAVDSRGKKVSIYPNILLHPPQLRWTVKKLLEAEKVLGSGNNDPNTVQNLLVPVEWRFLDGDADAWYIGQAKSGLKFYNRFPLTFDFFRNTDTGGYVAQAFARFGVEVNDFRYWVGSNFSTS